jgi:hypothetical protein
MARVTASLTLCRVEVRCAERAECGCQFPPALAWCMQVVQAQRLCLGMPRVSEAVLLVLGVGCGSK